MNRGDFFKGVMQWEFYHQEMDRKFLLPVFYYDNTAMTCIYTAGLSLIRGLLPRPEMHPVQITPGRALVAFSAFEYRRTDIDPYNEFSIAFPITYGRQGIPFLSVLQMMARRCFTAYVWQLPVTTEVARRGGVDLYGYPKFLAGIDFRQEKEALTCTLSEGGDTILTLRGKRLPLSREPVNRFKTWSVKDGVPLVTNVYMNPLSFGKSMGRDAASLTLGDRHPIARTLRGANLGRRPLFFQYMPRMEAILFGPRNLLDD